LFWTFVKKLRAKKTQNSRKKLKTQAYPPKVGTFEVFQYFFFKRLMFCEKNMKNLSKLKVRLKNSAFLGFQVAGKSSKKI